MKINELVEKINKHDGMRAKEVDKGIVISTPMGTFSIPKDATNFMEIDTWATNNSLYWSKSNREYLSALIEEFLHTPIKERFPEKKWLLYVGKDGHGQKIYLTKTGDSRKIGTTLNADCFTEWSGQDIQDIMKHFPKFAQVIDGMKEEVKDDAY